MYYKKLKMIKKLDFSISRENLQVATVKLGRQRGTKIYPGVNVGIGNDHTLYSKIDGVVKYERLGKDKKQACVYEK